MVENVTTEDAALLFQVLSFIAPVSASLRATFLAGLKKETLPKKHLLLREGEIARRIYFLNSGFARAYFLDAEGRQHTSWLMDKMDIMISVYSFYTQQPSAEYIELLEDSVVLSLSWDHVQLIYAEHPEFNYTGRLITEKYYIRSEERLILLRNKRPRERYELLLRSYPDILQKAPLGAIASFLAIDQATLSRIRGSKK